MLKKMRRERTLEHFWWEYNLKQPYGKEYESSSKKIIRTAYDSHLMSGYISSGNENRILKRCVHYCVYRSVIHNNKTWTHQCPLTNRYRSCGLCKQWSIIQLWERRKSVIFITWMDLQGIMLRKYVRLRKANTIWSHLYLRSKKS